MSKEQFNHNYYDYLHCNYVCNIDKLCYFVISTLNNYSAWRIYLNQIIPWKENLVYPYSNHIIFYPWCDITSLWLTDNSITDKKVYFMRELCLSWYRRFSITHKQLKTFSQVLGVRDETRWQGITERLHSSSL